MATELEGKPLKFTAVFESKDAEMKMDEFLKKVQNINTKGVSNNAAKAVNQSSGQYKSILTDVTQSFNDFVTSNDRFYSAIARSELALRKVNVEQNYLNAEMRRGLITDEEYIQKSAQLAQVRERLSAQLKDNKAQLQQYNSVASTKPKFTRQDTLNELGSAHGNISASPNLSATEAFARAAQQSIDKLNAELLELDANLKSGAITNDQYAKSAADINNKIKEAQLNQEHFNQNVGKGLAPTEEFSKQKTVLDAVSSEYKELVSEASSAFQSISPEAQKLTNNLVSLREENRKLSSAQKELDEAFKRGDITQNQYLQASRDLGVQQGAIKTRIAETRKEISQIDAAERKAIGSIAEKTAKLTQLKQRYDQLSEAQRNNINVGGKIRKEYQDLSKEVNKLNTSLSGTRSDGVGALFSSIQGIAGVMGIAFGTQQLVSFGKELFSIAQRAEGVELAFARIGDPTALDRLRVATKGTVSDLDLMTQAVRADKFRIPMDVLAKGLEFARRRANETGQSIDYLTESFVNGLGRQSKLILDNLGISTRELSEEIEKTGNFMKAVSNIMDKDLSRGGQVIDMLSDKTDRLASRWENVKKKISDVMRAWFYTGAGGASPEGIEKQVIALNKAYEGFDNRNSEQQKKVINQLQTELDFEKKRSQSIAKSIEEESIKRYGKVDAAFVSTMSQQKGLDKSLEKLNALEATLLKFKATNTELDKQNRQKQGIFSLEELEEKLSGAQTLLKSSVDKNEQAKLRKEIADYQKQIDAINGKTRKSSGKSPEQKLADQIKKDNETYNKLIEEFKDLGSKYTIEIVSPEQSEINKVIEEYNDKIEKAKEHNKTTKGKKIDINNLIEEQGASVNNIIRRQEKQADQKAIEEAEKKQKEAYDKMLDLAKNNEDEILSIRKKYQEAYKALEKDRTNITVEEFERRKEALKKNQSDEIGNILLPDLQKGQDWINVFDKTSTLARTKILQSVENLRASLKKMLDEGKITVEQYKDALKGIKDVEVQVTVNERGFGRIKQILKELKEAEKGSIKHDEARQKLAGEISNIGGGLVEAGGDVLNIMDSLGIGSEKFKEDMALSLDLAGNAVNLAASIASGDVVGMITNGIKTISSAINLFTKDRKIERQIKEYQKQLEQLGKTYDELAKKMGNSDTDYYSNAQAQLKNLADQEKALIKIREAERSKKKSDGEKIKSIDQQILDNRNQQLELEQSIRQMRLQTDINSLAQSLTDALTGAFEAGEDSIDALDKAFDKFIKNSLANSVRLKFIQKIVDDMLTDVDKYMAKNGNSIIGYDFSSWQDKLNNATKQANDYLDAAYEGLGLDKELSDSSSSLKGEGIERISEQSATEFIGLSRAQLDINKRQLLSLQAIQTNGVNYLTVANNQLAQLNAINTNTAQTVTELKSAVFELQEIKKSLR